MPTVLPLPPLELRELVGATDEALFDNPTGQPIFTDLPPEAWRSYLDFGCGCGRSARRLIQQHPQPERYVGVDLHRGMVQWCQEHLAPVAPGFSFVHHDVYNAGLNPNPASPSVSPLPVDDGSCSIVEATSVFTHLVEGQAEFYLDEVARVLTPDGLLIATWFLFEKDAFPYMQDNQNALYINDRDPTNAVAYDRDWLLAGLHARGLAIVRVTPPNVRGYHWHLRIARVTAGHARVELPPDDAPPGRRPPPLLRADAEHFGLEGVGFSPPVVASTRQEPPPLNTLASELAGAKEYIASLESHLSAAGEYIASLESHLGSAGEYLASLEAHGVIPARPADPLTHPASDTPGV